MCSLSTGSSITPLLGRRASDDLARDHHHFLVGERDVLARLDRGERGTKPERADQRRDDHRGFGMGRDGDGALGAVQDRHLIGPEPRGQLARELRSRDQHQLGPKPLYLLGQPIEIAARRQRDDLEPIREAAHNVERGDADRTGRAQNRDRFHRAPVRFALRSAVGQLDQAAAKAAERR